MAGTFKKICLLMLASAALGANAQQDDASVVLNYFKLPEYNKESKKLEYIIYGDKAETLGVMINLQNVKVEWIGLDISDVKATLTTPKAEYDRATKIIRGDDKVHFRSQEMDADGVGFDADHQKKLIHIRSNVKVTLKQDLRTANQRESGLGPAGGKAMPAEPTIKTQ